MNKKQLFCLWIGIIIIVATGLFPPWHTEISGLRRNWGYAFILIPPKLSYSYSNPESTAVPIINIPRLLIQWSIVGFITTGFILTFKH